MTPEKRLSHAGFDDSLSRPPKRVRRLSRQSSVGSRPDDATLRWIKTNERDKPSPSDVLKTGELLTMIATALHKRGPVDPLTGLQTAIVIRNLSNFRLVSKAFAAAGAIPMFAAFEAVGDDPRHAGYRKDGNSVKHLQGMLRKHAPHVRALQFSGFDVERDCKIIVPESVRSELSPVQSEQWTFDALSISLGCFKGLRTLHIELPSDYPNEYLDLWLNLVGRVNLPRLDTFFIKIRPYDELPLPPRLRWFDEAHAPKLIKQLKYVSMSCFDHTLLHTENWEMERLARQALKLIRRLTVPSAAPNLETLCIDRWYISTPERERTMLPPQPALPTSHIRNVKNLSLALVNTSGRSLCDLLIRGRGTVKKLALISIELTSGYWHEILEELKRKEHQGLWFVTGHLGYWHDSLKMQPACSLGPVFYGQRAERAEDLIIEASDFRQSTFITLNPRDRAAALELLPHRSTSRIALATYLGQGLGDLTESERKFALKTFFCTHARCAGLNRGGESRCKRQTDVCWDESIDFWVHKADRSRIDKTWLCHIHRNQMERLLIWPWELPG